MTARQNRWVITGAAGFLGSHLCEQLLGRGERVLGVDNLKGQLPQSVRTHNRFEFCLLDIRDEASLTQILRNFHADVLVHLAALHFIPTVESDPSSAISHNVHGTQAVLSACRQNKVKKIFFASTSDVYAPSNLPHTECAEVSPLNVYGLSKLYGERLVEIESSRNPETSFTVGRLFNLYGPRETTPHIIPEVLKQIDESPNEPLRLGNLTPYRDFVPVEEAAKAVIELCLQAHSGVTTVNIATGQSWPIKKLIETLCDELGQRKEIQVDRNKLRAVEREYVKADVSRLKGLLGWVPHSNLPQGVRQLIRRSVETNSKLAG